jgi:hypothetical protein
MNRAGVRMEKYNGEQRMHGLTRPSTYEHRIDFTCWHALSRVDIDSGIAYISPTATCGVSEATGIKIDAH